MARSHLPALYRASLQPGWSQVDRAIDPPISTALVPYRPSQPVDLFELLRQFRRALGILQRWKPPQVLLNLIRLFRG